MTMKITIDGTDIRALSLDRLGAALQQISNEIDRRGYTLMAQVIDEAGTGLRNEKEEEN
jgi:hypothetical protein